MCSKEIEGLGLQLYGRMLTQHVPSLGWISSTTNAIEQRLQQTNDRLQSCKIVVIESPPTPRKEWIQRKGFNKGLANQVHFMLKYNVKTHIHNM